MNMIPKILHMVWVGKKEPPQYFWDNLNKWKSLMPHWTYMIWTNDKLTEEFFDKDYLELMKQVINPSQVSDFIRFYVMDKWGGYYLDADVTPLRNLEELPIRHPIVLCNDLPETGPNYMMCAFMAGIPNHPLWKLCVEECKREDLSIKYGVGITPTGPAVLGRVSQQMINWSRVGGYTHLPYWYFYRNRIGDPGPYMPDRIMRNHPDGFGHHFYAASWR
jgi:mannosyltransferase OCH1-like enzyme